MKRGLLAGVRGWRAAFVWGFGLAWVSGGGARAAEPDTARPAILIAGDSTAAAGGGGGQQGWGVPFAGFFDAAKVEVVNGARGGRSSRTFITDGSWERVIARAKRGDVMLIQFGHNDGGAINEEPEGSGRPLRARGSLPGLGEEAREIDNVLTKKREVVRTFGWYVRKMIAETKAKGAAPVVLSLTVRNYWQDGRIERGSGRYGAWLKAVAEREGVAFIDLTTAAAAEFDKIGEEGTKAYFQPDRTHTNARGAELHARLVVAGLRRVRAEVGEWVGGEGGRKEN